MIERCEGTKLQSRNVDGSLSCRCRAARKRVPAKQRIYWVVLQRHHEVLTVLRTTLKAHLTNAGVFAIGF